MSLGIKETKEIIEGMGEAAVTGKKVVEIVKKALENGFGVEDLALLGTLMGAMPDTSKLEAASKDASVALEELKDLDKEEVVQIIASLYAEADRFNKA